MVKCIQCDNERKPYKIFYRGERKISRKVSTARNSPYGKVYSYYVCSNGHTIVHNPRESVKKEDDTEI